MAALALPVADGREPRDDGIETMICPDAIYTPGVQARRLAALRVVVTRYNINFWATRQASAAWFGNRLDYFTRFCLPSVLAQVERPDLWLIGFDGEGDRSAVAPVLDTVREHPWIVPVWHRKISETEYESFVHCLRREIVRHLAPQTTHVISARLDSDDALNRRYFEYLCDYSAIVAGTSPDLADFWISFPVGSIYSEGKCSLRVYTNNPFLARVQTVSHLTATKKSTALSGGHTRVFERGRVFLATTTEPMWIQTVHGTNIKNRTRGKWLTFASAHKILLRSGVVPRKSRFRRLAKGFLRLAGLSKPKGR